MGRFITRRAEEGWKLEATRKLSAKKRLDPLTDPSGHLVDQRTGERQGWEWGDQTGGYCSLGERVVVAETNKVVVGKKR